MLARRSNAAARCSLSRANRSNGVSSTYPSSDSSVRPRRQRGPLRGASEHYRHGTDGSSWLKLEEGVIGPIRRDLLMKLRGGNASATRHADSRPPQPAIDRCRLSCRDCGLRRPWPRRNPSTQLRSLGARSLMPRLIRLGGYSVDCAKLVGIIPTDEERRPDPRA